MSEENKQPEEDQTPATETPAVKAEKPHPLATLKAGNQKVAEVKAVATEKVKEALKKQAEAIDNQKSTVTQAQKDAAELAQAKIDVAAETVAALEAQLAAAKAQLKQAKAEKKPTIKAAVAEAKVSTTDAIKEAGNELTQTRKATAQEIAAAKKERTSQVANDFGTRITVEFNEATDVSLRVGKGVALGVYRPLQHIGQISKAGFKEGYESETKYGKRAEELKKKAGGPGPK